MHTERLLAPDLPSPPVAGEDFAEGLMLLRASTLKVIRLQLAIERQDRRVALEAMDDLVALDDELQKCLAHMPAPGDLAAFRDVLALERSSLDREKLGLAAGIIGGRSKPEPAHSKPVQEQAFAHAPSCDWHRFRYEEEETAPRRGWIWAGGLILILSALVAAAYVLGYVEIIRDFARW